MPHTLPGIDDREVKRKKKDENHCHMDYILILIKFNFYFSAVYDMPGIIHG